MGRRNSTNRGQSVLAFLALVTVLHQRPRDWVTKASTPTRGDVG
jgi:hypothetical protein